LEDHPPVHDPGHDVVKGSAGSEEAGGSHGGEEVNGDGSERKASAADWLEDRGFSSDFKRCKSVPLFLSLYFIINGVENSP
jgi:hypothetical protein